MNDFEMVFKLIRVDTLEPSKIQLSIGKHIIGRGKFLHNDDSDKRVSRKHAELHVTEDTITLKSLHQNPCFYIKKSTQETKLLEQNCETCLCNGDKFGLIPETFWYEIIHCSDINNADLNVPSDVPDRVENGLAGEESVDESGEKTVCPDNDSDTEIMNYNMNEDQKLDRESSPSLLTTDQENHDSENTQEYNSSVPAAPKSPLKRSLSEDNPADDVKKVKIEPDDPGDARPGPSNDQAGASDADNGSKAAAPSPLQPPNAPQRERCIYGGNCYRRNPQHKAQFSHPSDPDWGVGERGACPFGASCRRRDPRHWQAHSHPPGTRPPDHRDRPGKKKKRRRVSINSDSSEDVPGDLIVTGKRVRRTVQRDTWSGSEDEDDDDPFGTDESDEWEPPSDVTNSQDFTQDF